MQVRTRCDACKGNKKVMGMGMMSQECLLCHGQGYVTEDIKIVIAKEVSKTAERMAEEATKIISDRVRTTEGAIPAESETTKKKEGDEKNESL